MKNCRWKKQKKINLHCLIIVINNKNKIRKSFLFIAILISAFTLTAISQSNIGVTIKAQLVKDFERAKAYTLEYLAAMPADKYGFKAHDPIRSFAQQMLHLAQGSIGLSSNATGKDRIWGGQNLEARASAQSADSVKYFVTTSYDFVIDGLKAMDAIKLEEKNKRGNFDESRLAWLLKAFEHQSHHRGQTTIYIRLLGVKPPNEKLF